MTRCEYIKTLSLRQMALYLAENDIYINDDPDDNEEWLKGWCRSMSELTKGFEKVFPLPWKMQRRGTWEYINAENGSGLDICIIPSTDYEPKKAARQYLVQCANLMPEAVELLDDAQNIMKWTCELCDGEACGRCGGCDVKGIGSRIAALLAKLEGCVENARD